MTWKLPVVQQTTIEPLHTATIVSGSTMFRMSMIFTPAYHSGAMSIRWSAMRRANMREIRMEEKSHYLFFYAVIKGIKDYAIKCIISCCYN